MKQLFRWYWLLNKRLFRRASFWAILAAIPILVLALRVVSAQQSGIVTIAIGCEDPFDAAAQEIVLRLTERHSILDLRLCSDAAAARELVTAGEADAAWLFPKDLSGRLQRAAGGNPVTLVEILEQEENVFLQLSREKLFAALYPDLSYAVYRDYVLTELPTDPAPSEADLNRYYLSAAQGSQFIAFSFMDGGEAQELERSYLVMPVRGLLAILMMLSALASGMYLAQDEAAETFAWLSGRKKYFFPLLFHLVPVLDMALAALLALWVTGLADTGVWEIPLMLAYCICCAAFAEILRCLLGTARRIGAALPILILGMLALSPVFLNVRRLRPLQFLLPPFHYLHAVHSRTYFLYLCVYAAASCLIALALGALRRRRA